MLEFPQIDPIAIQIGPLAIRWYALAYIAGIVLGWRMLRRLAATPPQAATAAQVDATSPGPRSASSWAGGWAMCCSIGRGITCSIRWKR